MSNQPIASRARHPFSHMDDAVGRMIDALKRTGQREQTLVIFTSDNGAPYNHTGNTYPPPDPGLKIFSSNKPLRGKKWQPYERGCRMPALVDWPGTLAPRKVAAPTSAVDWMPTLSALVGQKPDKDPERDGRDI